MKEAHRRARFYCDDYGRPGVNLLAYSVIILQFGMSRRREDTWQWELIGTLWTEQEKSTILSMDRNTGLGLTYLKPDWHSNRGWADGWNRNGWVRSYLHLIARPDFVVDIARLHDLEQHSSLADDWRLCLSFNRSTVSTLRNTVSYARRESVYDDHITNYLLGIKDYTVVSPEQRFFPSW